MAKRYPRLAALVLAGVLASGAAWAAEPPQKIVGQDVMGDRSRSGPDGWVQAPVTRDQTPTGAMPGADSLNRQPGPAEGRALPPGQDPGTPAKTDANGPGQIDQPKRP